jgi:hypothetical protein
MRISRSSRLTRSPRSSASSIDLVERVGEFVTDVQNPGRLDFDPQIREEFFRVGGHELICCQADETAAAVHRLHVRQLLGASRVKTDVPPGYGEAQGGHRSEARRLFRELCLRLTERGRRLEKQLV